MRFIGNNINFISINFTVVNIMSIPDTVDPWDVKSDHILLALMFNETESNILTGKQLNVRV